MKYFILSFLILMPLAAQATDSHLARRMDRISAKFLGKPYGDTGPLGEGAKAEFDRDPLFRTDTFDCTTYVESVIALAKARGDRHRLLRWMNRIRYMNNKVSFETRNHFTALEWIPNNVRKKVLFDITHRVDPEKFTVAVALVEKDEWYKKLDKSRVSGWPEAEKDAKLEELKARFVDHGKFVETIPYLKKEEIVARPEMLDRIPNGSVINVVRPNWDLVKAIGTHMNVSHQGFAFRKADGVLYLRHARPNQGVVEQPLLDYVKETIVPSTSAQGINVLVVRGI